MTLHLTQSRHITCAASPLSVEKLPPPLESPTSKHYHRPLTERHAGGARQLRRYRIGQHTLLRRVRCPMRRLRSACAPCSSGRAVVGTTPGASNLAALGDLHPTQSRHIACAASPLSVEKLPPPLESPTSKHYHRPLTERHAGGARQLRRYRIGQHTLLRRVRCPMRRLRSACAPCSSGRAVVGTTPGASNLAALGDLHPTQSRHIACAAKPLGCKKLPPTATGTAAHIEGRRLFHTSRAKLRSALLMFHSSAPPVARRCGCVWVPSAAPQLRKRSASSPLLGTHTQPRLTDCVPNLETLPRWWRTFCSLAPHLCGFTAVVRVDACTLSSLRSARARIHTHNGSKVEPFLCGFAA